MGSSSILNYTVASISHSKFLSFNTIHKYLNFGTFFKHMLATFVSRQCLADWWWDMNIHLDFSAFMSRPTSVIASVFLFTIHFHPITCVQTNLHNSICVSVYDIFSPNNQTPLAQTFSCCVPFNYNSCFLGFY
jgi:hypothetical protein